MKKLLVFSFLWACLGLLSSPCFAQPYMLKKGEKATVIKNGRISLNDGSQNNAKVETGQKSVRKKKYPSYKDINRYPDLYSDYGKKTVVDVSSRVRYQLWENGVKRYMNTGEIIYADGTLRKYDGTLVQNDGSSTSAKGEIIRKDGSQVDEYGVPLKGVKKMQYVIDAEGDQWYPERKHKINKDILAKTPKGVYLLDKRGNLIEIKDFDSRNKWTAVGVALITENTRALIALHNAREKVVWGPDGMVNGVSHSNSNSNSDPENITSDYDGIGNTTKLIRALSPTPSTALMKARNFVFPNGAKGYLPALGEIIDMFKNIELVNAALEKVGGDPIVNEWYWTSSLHLQNYRAWSYGDPSGTRSFAQLRNNKSPLADKYGAAYIQVRPFGPLE